MAFIGLTKPAAGVTATRPTTIAVAAPTAVGLPERMMSSTGHATRGPAAPSILVTKASPAIGLAANALPELNPNHPNQSRPAPSSTNGTLCGISEEDL